MHRALALAFLAVCIITAALIARPARVCEPTMILRHLIPPAQIDA